MLFTHPNYTALLDTHALNSFDNFWQLPKNWIEEPNHRRNGWSGVSTHSIEHNGVTVDLFIKRQQNHNSRTFQHPFGAPTFRKEFINIQTLEERDIPTLEVVFYGEKIIDKQQCAVLATLALSEHVPLDDWATNNNDDELSNSVCETVGRVVRKCHDANLQHRSLYGKHLFVSTQQSPPDIRFIDLEKMRQSKSTVEKRAADLGQLFRHSDSISQSQKQHLLNHYLHDNPYWSKKLVTTLNQLIQKKHKKGPVPQFTLPA